MIELAARHGHYMNTECRENVLSSRASWRTRLGAWLSGIFLLAPGLPMRSQQQPAPQATPQAAPQTTIPVEVKVVNVLATVRKKKGEIVRNLTKDDFALEEDGRPQTIRYFAQETDLPLTLGLLVDTSGSQRRVLDQERSASSTFLDQVLRVDKDQAFVIHFDREVELLQDLTSSRQKLDAALQSLQTPQFSRQGGGSDSSDSQSDPQQGSHRRGGGGGGTLLYDAVYLASNELMMKQTGRKALIVLSDGVDHGSKETLASAIEAAQRADTLVYSILFKAEQEYGNGGFGGRGGGMGGRGGMGRHGGGGRYPQQLRPDGKKILERISKETGGRLFEVSKKEPIEQIYDSVQEELRNQYSLGYTPNPPNTGPGYHKITLTTRKSDLIVQTRDGYYVSAPSATTK
ncbi:MAG TPA: VWA domain-containing protein [Terriglobia bacterium]|nr:VWA domain-containing protein [Terriglobia bacterium]